MMSIALLALLAVAPPAQQPVVGASRPHIEAIDGVRVFATLRERVDAPDAPFLVFFHDASGSRGEARPLLPRFWKAGYQYLSVDLRAGASVKQTRNQTAHALPAGADGSLMAAERDVLASLQFLREGRPTARIVAVGCSYSASLALRVASDHPGLVDGVVAFSPAEYFTGHGMPATWIRDSVGELTQPVLFLSSRSEQEEWDAIFDAIPSTRKSSFVPVSKGRHGMRALWESTPEHLVYWAAVETFLAEHFPVDTAGTIDADPPAPADDTEAPDESADEGDPAGTKDPPAHAPDVLDRVVVLGASVSDGLFLQYDLQDVLELMIERDHAPVLASSSVVFFSDPLGTGREQIDFAREAGATLLVGVDYLFWFAYGLTTAEGRPLASEEERLPMLERGLAFLDELDCPIVVGDFPDMSDSVGLMLMRSQVPEPATLVALNDRLSAWAAERPDVSVVPLASVHAEMRSGRTFTMGRQRWAEGTVLLQPDQLHANTLGLVGLAHLIGVELVERGWAREEDLLLDVGAVLDRCRGSQPATGAAR